MHPEKDAWIDFRTGVRLPSTPPFILTKKWEIAEYALWPTFTGHKAYCFVMARIAIELKLSQYLSRSRLKQRRTAFGKYRHRLCIFCFYYFAKTRESGFALITQGNSHAKVTRLLRTGYVFCLSSLFSTGQGYGEFSLCLYKDLKHSLDPVIYEILYQTIEKITVSNEGVDIELTIWNTPIAQAAMGFFIPTTLNRFYKTL